MHHLPLRVPSSSTWAPRALLAIGLLLAACSPPPAAAPTAAPASAPATQSPGASPVAVNGAGTRKQLKVGTLPTIGNAPFIIAQQRGYFADEGLDVELVQFASGAEAIAPLATGQVDAANSINPSAGLLNAIMRGLSVKIVADNGSIRAKRNIANIMVRKALAPTSGALDLATLPRPIKAAAAAEGLVAHAIILLEAERAGLQISDVSMTFLGLPDMNVALSNGGVDLVNSGEPLITLAVQQGIAVRWKPMADLYANMPYSNLIFGPNLLEKDRDAGQRLVRAYLRGARDYEDAFSKGKDRDAIVAMLQGPLNMPGPLLQAMQDQGGLAYINPDGAVDTAPLKPILDLWERTKVVPPGFDLSTLTDASFANDAVAKLGKYQ